MSDTDRSRAGIDTGATLSVSLMTYYHTRCNREGLAKHARRMEKDFVSVAKEFPTCLKGRDGGLYRGVVNQLHHGLG